jgi:CubicO group peptidase (beta-lactamase class C family)
MIRTDAVIVTMIGALLSAGSAPAQVNIEQIVTQKIQPILPKNGSGGGVAVAVRMNGKTSFFKYGMADNAQNRPVTADSIFNLGSVGKVFATTLLAQAVKQGELSLDDPVAKYVTEVQRGGDIRRITLGQLASHSSGLPREPQQYETWHRGRYTWPDFVRFSIPERQARTMNLGNNISIPMRPWSCCELPSNAVSTRGSRP